MWYIFDKNSKCIAISNQEPDIDDLESREEKAYKSTDSIPLLEAVLLNDKVVRAEPIPQIITPPVSQDIADIWEAIFALTAEKGGM